MADSIVVAFGGEPEHAVRIMKYSDLGVDSFTMSYGELHVVPSASKVKQAPRSAAIFQTLGLWLLPVVLMWFVLLVLSLRRAELLPNQRLHLTPRVGAEANGPEARCK